MTDAQFDLLMEFCTKYVGEEYALKDVLMIPLGDLGIKYSTDGDSKQYCAELVMRALGEMGGKELTQNVDRVKLKYVYDFVKEKHEKGGVV